MFGMGTGGTSSLWSPSKRVDSPPCVLNTPRVEQAPRLSRKIEEDAGPTGWPLSTAAMVKPNGQLVLVSFTHRCASTSSLSTLWSSRTLQGELISRGASHLDAFSGYPVRTWLPGSAAGATTGTPEVRPPRSSRTRGSSSQFSKHPRQIGTELSHDVLNPAHVPL